MIWVVVPAYNEARVIGGVVEELVARGHRVVVVDDGSSDDTPAVLAAIDDPRVRTLRAPNLGPGRARNLAIAEARGAWIAFLDDDNEWRPTYLERQLATAAAMPDAVAVYCPAQTFDDETNEVGDQTPWYTMAGDLFAPMMRRGYPRVSGTMVRHATLTEVGGFPPDLQ